MLNNRTVLILGAGASMRYGYPSGEGLKRTIVSHLTQALSSSGQQIGPHDNIDHSSRLISYLKQFCNFTIPDLQEFCNDFRESPRASIDSFLQEREKFLDIGKILIAYSIFRSENTELLYGTPSSTEQSWYQFLFNEIAEQLVKESPLSLTIITYNYDRSFESYFINGLIKTFGLTPIDAVQIFSRIKLVHVHGVVGSHPWDGSFKPYGDKIHAGYINEAAQKLHIIFEEKALQDAYSSVKSNYTKLKIFLFLDSDFIKIIWKD